MAALSKLSSVCGKSLGWEGCSQTLHRNYLLLINNDLEQAEDEKSVEGVEPINEPNAVPQAQNELPANRLTESQLESLHNLPPKQHKLVDLGLTESVTPYLTNDRPQGARTSLLH